MKKALAIMMVVAMTLLLAACGKSETTSETKAAEAETTAAAAAVEAAVEETTAAVEAAVPAGKTIGFSISSETTDWAVAFCNDIIKSLEAKGYEVKSISANAEVDKQISDCEDFVSQGVDALLLYPAQKDGSVPCVQIAAEAGLPCVVVNRTLADTVTLGKEYQGYVGNDFVKEGEMMIEWALENVPGDVLNIVEITGKPGVSSMVERQTGIMNIVDANDNVNIVSSQSGEWQRQTAMEVMDNIIQAKAGQFNVVVCHTDEMALGAVVALETAGYEVGKDVYVLAVNGMKEAVQAVCDGRLSCIVTCTPFQGEAIANMTDAILKGESYEQNVIIDDYYIDSKNCESELLIAY